MERVQVFMFLTLRVPGPRQHVKRQALAGPGSGHIHLH